MNHDSRIPKNHKIWPFIIVLLSATIQGLFSAGYFWGAVFFGACASVAVFFSREYLWNISGTRSKYRCNWLPWLLWVAAIIVRTRYITDRYPIQDLSARFTLAAIEISRGNPVFPFIPQYEYDESLISWFFAPFLALFGHAWITVKVLSVVIGTSLVPVTFIYVRKLINTPAAYLASAAVLSSSYFQYSDPMIDMSRFSLVAVCLLLALMSLDNMLSPHRHAAWSILTGLFLVIPAYIHSIGRIHIVIAAVTVICRCSQRKNRIPWNVVRPRLFQLAGVSMALILPLVVYILKNPGYLEFKRRQIFGLHDMYPFSWIGLYENFKTVLTGFHYKSGLHMLFPPDKPLLHPVIGAGVIGGIWLLLKNQHRQGFPGLMTAILFTTVPLSFVTPGHWRGLYLSPAVALLTLTAGIFYFWCVENIFGAKKPGKTNGLMILVSVLLTGALAAAQLPRYSKIPFLPPRINQITLLYEDLSEAPDVPHYFSHTIPEMIPGFAICDLVGSAWLSEYAVLYFEPLQIRSESGVIWDTSREAVAFDEIRVVLSQYDRRHLPALEKTFGAVELSQLPNSSLYLGVIRRQP
jgi:hypothetical protein